MPVVFLRRSVAALLLLSMIACGRGPLEDLRLTRLKPGVSTEQEVRGIFGTPAAMRDLGGGTRGLVYPLGPEGLHTLLLKIGPDGRYAGYDNLLTRANFETIRPGLSEAEVLQRLGPPGSTQSYALKRQRALEWRFLDGNDARMFVVMLDSSGTVVSTAIEEDPRRLGGGG
jgi:hypothetical protein